MNGDLGRLSGLRCTVIVSTSLKELASMRGHADDAA
jgi:hypothetical protein